MDSTCTNEFQFSRFIYGSYIAAGWYRRLRHIFQMDLRVMGQ